MGDRVAVMNGGVLQQLAPPRELYDHPVNLFVASFIGAPPINLLPGIIRRQGDGLAVELPNLTVPLSAGLLARKPGLGNYVDREMIVGVRPESVFVVGEGVPALGGTVAFQEDLGCNMLVYVDLDVPAASGASDRVALDEFDEGAPAAVSTRIRINAPASMRQKIGDRLAARLDVEAAHFFDPTSQLAIG